MLLALGPSLAFTLTDLFYSTIYNHHNYDRLNYICYNMFISTFILNIIFFKAKMICLNYFYISKSFLIFILHIHMYVCTFICNRTVTSVFIKILYIRPSIKTCKTIYESMLCYRDFFRHNICEIQFL